MKEYIFHLPTRHHADQKQKLDQDQRQSHEMELRKYKRKRLTGNKKQDF